MSRPFFSAYARSASARLAVAVRRRWEVAHVIATRTDRRRRGRDAIETAGGCRRAAEQDYSDELQAIRNELLALRNKVTTPTVNEIRDRQRGFLRLNQRFPQCVDVGIRIWERMQDWHIDNGRVLTVQRAGDGHWQMDFIMSVLVLKLELKDDEIGQAYDR